MDSFPIPESDSLLAQVQANIDLQQEGLHSVLGSIGSAIADGLDLQAKNNKKCIRKLEKQIRDNLSFQNAKLQGVIDQLLTVVTTLIGEQGVALAQIQGEIGLAPQQPQQGGQNAISSLQFPAGTLPIGGGNAAGLAGQQGSGTSTIRPLEGSFPVLPNLLRGTVQSAQHQDGTVGTAYTRPFFPTISSPANTTPQQKAVPQPQDTGGEPQRSGGQAGQQIASFPLPVQSAIATALASIGLTVENAPPSILQPILDIALSAFQSRTELQTNSVQIADTQFCGDGTTAVCVASPHVPSSQPLDRSIVDRFGQVYVLGDDDIPPEDEPFIEL